ncbi:ABC transporter permease [Paenibacillus spongiae]|uniref:ABC transporter permease subunit n=1 Tax=Paenibacillus spongiae TaxID=2909671 RepID=A0ABY5S6A7_9BACL|nr:ABC transporter permease subunit [Paenibacillus spongiae]UVI29432.1 ABC transporter permease subunit [Paenibacillus spongiae]
MSRQWRLELPLLIMLLPGTILVLIYSYGPMLGIVIAFEKFIPSKGMFGSKWIGLDNFRQLLDIPNFFQVFWNTVFIAVMKIIAGLIVPMVFALLLNEVRHTLFKRGIQTLVYLPHFLSWVILSGILIDILSPNDGFVNNLLKTFGMEPVFFLGDPHWFPYTLIISDVWKEFGFGTIIYLAALTGIDPTLYEAAVMDGAGRWRQTFHITLPGIRSVAVLLTVLSLGNVLNAGFDQVFNLYSPVVYETGDIIDTLVYRTGLIDAQYGLATAVGLIKSVISFTLIVLSYRLAYRFANYRIF